MKRIIFINIILSSILLFSSCDTPLNEYQPKSEDEKQIVALLQTFVEARNSQDLKIIRSLFHDNGIYYKGMGGEIKASDIESTDPEWWTSFGKFGITDPEITINGNEAQISMNTIYGNGRFQAFYVLVKEDGKWLINTVRQ